MPTFFDPRRTAELTRAPYSVHEFVARKRREGCPEDEADLFHRLLENEAGSLAIDVPGSGVAGPLVFRWNGDRIDLAKQGGFLGLPHWVEADVLRVERCPARGILLFEHGRVARAVWKSGVWKDLKLLIVAGGGVPAVHTRRFLHLLQKRFKLPVYLLVDNDTRGYFIFSVLKRGSVLPHQEHPHLKLDLRYLGLRAGEFERKFLVAPHASDSPRLRALRRYACFQSAAWKREFDAFHRQELAVLGQRSAHPRSRSISSEAAFHGAPG